MRSTIIAAVAAAAIAVAGCAQQDGRGGISKTTGGTLVGAGLGGLAGAQVGKGKGQLAAVAIGALAGAFLGREVGKSLDRADRLAMERTAQGALEKNRSGTTSTWRNPDSGNQGEITPTKTYQTASGQYCREYQQTVVIDGRSQRAYGKACREPDGSWRIVR